MLPELVAFDLDDTLWDISGMDRDETSFYTVGINHIRDGSGNDLSLGRDMPRILNYLHDKRVPMAISSHNGLPRRARKALDLLTVKRTDGRTVSVSSFFGSKIEISQDSKTVQLKRLGRKAGVSSFKNMILYDDDKRTNGHVQKDLGMTFVQSTKSRLDYSTFMDGLDDFAGKDDDDDDDNNDDSDGKGDDED